MNYLNPIFTEKRECQDCYKCVRNCPVKAIKVEGGYASVMPELCIVCGQCVEVCPNGAKRVRDDLPQARRVLQEKPAVYVSLAPSYVTEFAEVRPGQIIRALKQLGFAGVSETALGAQEVSAQAAALMAKEPGRVLASSACPTVVAWFQKHRPQDSRLLTGLLSPLLTHCQILRQTFGAGIGVVFVGPCIAKKLEAGRNPELLDVALTFEDLRRWLEQEKISLPALEERAEDRFVPGPAAEGVWYPVDGGMIAGMKARCAVNDGACMAFSGLPALERALDGLTESPGGDGLFLELLACEGGCVNGPKACRRNGTAAKRRRVLQQSRSRAAALPRAADPKLNIRCGYEAASAAPPRYAEAQIREALRQVGKLSREDELNCGGCGYESCREFAAALMNQKAERSMCVTYMRKLALKKADALIQKMPSAVVIVNDALRIIESNGAFARLFGKGTADPAGTPASFDGVLLSEVTPFAGLFHSVLKSGEDLLDKDLRYQQTILHVTIFSIEKHAIVGGILQDITEPAVRKAEVIRKAREVIQRSLETTQKIACLLGENAAESEITLNSIIQSFSPEKPDESRTDHDWRKLYRR